MSVVEKVTQELEEARCQHCGELAFVSADGAPAFDVIPDEEREKWALLLEAEDVRRHQPADPQPALDAALATEVGRLQGMRAAEADLEDAQRAVEKLTLVSGKERRQSVQSSLVGAEKRLAKAQSEHRIAEGVLANAQEAQQVRAEHDRQHGDLFERASAARAELFSHVDELARRAHQLRPVWLEHVPGPGGRDDIEQTIARTRAVVAYRRLWDVADPVSPFGPAPSPLALTFRHEMRRLVEIRPARTGLAYLDFLVPGERTESVRS
jgi:hypothetical protein